MSYYGYPTAGSSVGGPNRGMPAPPPNLFGVLTGGYGYGSPGGFGGSPGYNPYAQLFAQLGLGPGGNPAQKQPGVPANFGQPGYYTGTGGTQASQANPYAPQIATL